MGRNTHGKFFWKFLGEHFPRIFCSSRALIPPLLVKTLSKILRIWGFLASLFCQCGAQFDTVHLLPFSPWCRRATHGGRHQGQSGDLAIRAKFPKIDSLFLSLFCPSAWCSHTMWQVKKFEPRTRSPKCS